MTDRILPCTAGGAHRPIPRAIDATASRYACFRFGSTLQPEAAWIAGGKVAGPESTVEHRDDRRREKP